jgi:hypothetical protein
MTDNIDFGFDIKIETNCACDKNEACQCNNEEKVKEILTKKENNAKSDI